MAGAKIAADYDAVIVGAGVGGAACALALARQAPLRVLLVERQAGPGKINRGDSLLPAVTRLFDAWGILDRCRAAGARPLWTMQVFHHARGRLLEAPLGSDDRHPYLVLAHPEIERVLTDAALAAGKVEVVYRCRATGLIEEDGRVVGVTLAEEDGREHRVRARLVIGADGAASAVREILGIPLPRRPYDHGYFGAEVNRPDGYQDAMRVELHPDGGVLVVPTLNPERVGLGVLVRPRDEALFRAGSDEDRLSAIRQRSPLLAGSRTLAPGAHLYRLVRAHAPRYTARGAVLIGDAVHVTNPTAGQGMTMAIEDAAALARHAGPVLAAGGGGDLAPLLDAYERERRPRNAALIRWSHWMSRFYALDGPLGDWVRRRVFAFGGSAVGRRIQRGLWSRMATRLERVHA